MTPGFHHYPSSIFKELESRGDNECDAEYREAWLDCVCVGGMCTCVYEMWINQ